MTTADTMNAQTPPEPGRRPRRPMILVALAVVVLLAIAAVIGQQSKSAPKPPPATVGTQLDKPMPSAIAQLPLVDETGKSTNLAAFDGKIVVLTDFMTLCQEVCPITVAQLRQVDEKVLHAGLADKVQFVLITVDPERDTPEQLHAYRSFAELPSNFSLLTGTPDNLATLWKYFGAGYQRQHVHEPATNWRTGEPLTYDVQHTDVLVYLDATSTQRYAIVGMPTGTGAPLTAGERSFLNDEGRENLEVSGPGNWTPDQALQVVSWLAKKHL